MARRVLIVAHPGVLGTELFGAQDIFALVNMWLARMGHPAAYRVEIATLDGSPVRLWGGMEAGPAVRLQSWRASIDMLVVAGGLQAVEASEDRAFVAAVRQAASRAQQVVALCTGAFIVAATGLLDGRRATTHWAFGDELAVRHPAVVVDTAPIFIEDGGLWTSAGVTAGYDLLLALVEREEGAEAARFVARALVVYLRRTANQAQFSAQLEVQLADRHPFRELQQFITEHPGEDLSLAGLAAQMHMSPRHLARVFRRETGMSPGRYVERARLETARRRLEESDASLEAIAVACGFGTCQSMRRIFVKALGIAPAEYRRRFGPAHGPALELVV